MLERLGDRLGHLPRPVKQAVMMLADVGLLLAAAWGAYALRLGTWFEPNGRQCVLIAAAPPRSEAVALAARSLEAGEPPHKVARRFDLSTSEVREADLRADELRRRRA
jgi:hypothetical protein